MTLNEFKKELADLKHKVIYFHEYEERNNTGSVFGYTPIASRQRLNSHFIKNKRLGSGKYA